MHILKEVTLEILLRQIPEAIMLNLGLYTFSKIRINQRRFYIGVLIVAVLPTFIMLLPITYGIHTPLIAISTVLLFQKVHHMNMIIVTKATIVSIIIEVICEMINVLGINLFVSRPITEILSNDIDKVIYGAPSVILSNTIIIIVYLRQRSKGKLSVF